MLICNVCFGEGFTLSPSGIRNVECSKCRGSGQLVPETVESLCERMVKAEEWIDQFNEWRQTAGI
jgi:DnaJ-class molecular chaperone